MITSESIKQHTDTISRALANRTMQMVVHYLINDVTSAQAAAQLGVHKNTMHQAIKRVKSLYGVTTNAALILELLADKKIRRDAGVWTYMGDEV